MSVDENGFGPGAPYLLGSTALMPSAAKWVQTSCPTCGHPELIEIIRDSQGHIVGFRWHTQPHETLLPEAVADLAAQRALRKSESLPSETDQPQS